MKLVFASMFVASACSSSAPHDEVRPAWVASGPAVWSFEDGAGVPSTSSVDARGRTDEGLNLPRSSASYGPDVDLSTRLHADDGAIDRGGGLVWRALDERNYYVARWNPLEDNLRLYTVRDGARRLLVSIDAALEGDAWHELRATMKGARIVVVLDERFVLSFDDTTFTQGGAIGLWSKADASTTFDVPSVRSK